MKEIFLLEINNKIWWKGLTEMPIYDLLVFVDGGTLSQWVFPLCLTGLFGGATHDSITRPAESGTPSDPRATAPLGFGLLVLCRNERELNKLKQSISTAARRHPTNAEPRASAIEVARE